MKLARVSGDIVASRGADAVVNIAIVAPPDDPAWDGVSEIVMVNSAPGGADVVLAAGSVELLSGQVRNGIQVGTLVLPIPNDAQFFELTKVSVRLPEEVRWRSFNVGCWRFSRQTEEPLIEIVGDYPASMSDGGRATLHLKGRGVRSADISSIVTTTEGITLTETSIKEGLADVIEVSFKIECADIFDLYGFSPRLAIHTNEGVINQSLDPILVGYLDMPDGVARRIAER